MRPTHPAGATARSRPTSRRVKNPSDTQPSALHGAVLVLATALAGVLVVGWPYYVLPVAERVRHPFHPWLRPSGYVGQSAGLVALAIFLFLWLYPLRKKYRRLAWTGSLARWLDVHVSAALLLPLLVTIHAGWRFGGVIGLGFWAMMLVWCSGLVGRYLYARIPRSRAGIELSRDEITAERKRLLLALAHTTGLDPRAIEETLRPAPLPTHLGPLATLARLVRDDLARRGAARRLQRAWVSRRVPGPRLDGQSLARATVLVRQEVALTQQARVLQATHDLFRYWHVAHRPFAVLALTAVLIHVAVVVAVGATWLW
jgi:hypothetical protein